MESAINIRHLHYSTIDTTPIFEDLNLNIPYKKIGIVGKNGSGKTTLLKLILGELTPQSGIIEPHVSFSYVPQTSSFPAKTTVNDVLGTQNILLALERIEKGNFDEKDFEIVGEHWDIKNQIDRQLEAFKLAHLKFNQVFSSLSGGEKTRLLLAKAFLSDAQMLLLDEPSNNIDIASRNALYQKIKETKKACLIVSHDRTLLNCLEMIIDITSCGIKLYGCPYDQFVELKELEQSAAQRDLETQVQILTKTKSVIQTRKERHEQNISKGKHAKKAQIRAKGYHDKSGFHTAQERSEKTNQRFRREFKQKIDTINEQLQKAKKQIIQDRDIQADLIETSIPSNKMILEIKQLNFQYDRLRPLLQNFSLSIVGPKRIALVGPNGSGKSTLLQLIMQKIHPTAGKIKVGTERISYIDQHCEQLNHELSIIENFQRINPKINLTDSYRILDHFLFRNQQANKIVKQLSSGEKLRALLACILMSEQPPQLLIIDEPTNHLDLSSIEQLEHILNQYKGAMIAVSHDLVFLKNIHIDHMINSDDFLSKS